MRPVNDLFEAFAASLWGTMTSHGGSPGFLIPEYQRTYDWSEEKIGRLLEDCLNGQYQLTQTNESFTFLGTLILVKDKKKESTFDGASLSVVDGQQRLTTLLLTSCALIKTITEKKQHIENLTTETRNWLEKETEFQLNELFRCAIGQLQGRGRTYNYPRIIRHVDSRAKDKRDAEYSSIVSRFLMDFADYYQEEKDDFSFPKIDTSNGEEVRFKNNFDFILEQIQFIVDPESSDQKIDCDLLSSADFKKKGVRDLFEKLEVFGDSSKRDTALSEISKGGEADGLIRAILFATSLVSGKVIK